MYYHLQTNENNNASVIRDETVTVPVTVTLK